MASMNPDDLLKEALTELESLYAKFRRISRAKARAIPRAEVRAIPRAEVQQKAQPRAEVQQKAPPKCRCKCVELCDTYLHNQRYIDTLDTKEKILYAVKSNPCLLKYLKDSTKFIKDKEIVLTAVESN